jgi:hypothetical protein
MLNPQVFRKVLFWAFILPLRRLNPNLHQYSFKGGFYGEHTLVSALVSERQAP